jgi:hypothetical protein
LPQAGFHRRCILVVARIAEDIDGIIVRPAIRQLLVELPARRLGQVREHEATVDEKVGRHHSRTAAIGDDGKPRPGRPHAGMQGLCHREEIGIVVDAHDTGAVQCCIEDIVGTNECTGMRHGRAAALREAPRFHDDNGLGARCGPQGTHEPARFVNTLDVQHDRLCRRIDHEVIEDLAEVDVGSNAA